MEPREILKIIWSRLWLIILGAVLVSAATFEVSRRMTPIYEARVLLMVEQSKSAPMDYMAMLTGENLALTYSELLKTRPILEIVIANLNLGVSPDDLLEVLDTSLIPDTQLLELTVEDPQPQLASAIANEIALTFISLRNMEQQLQSIVALEEDVVTQIEELGELIKLNQSAVDSSPTSAGILAEDASLAQNTLSNQQSAYAILLETYLNIQFAQAQLLDVTVVEPAVVPMEPIRPNLALNTILGASVGLVFSVGVAFLIEYLNRSFETRDDVTRVLSLPTLGTIPRMRGKELQSGLVASGLPYSAVSEAYRAVRTNIRFASVGEPLNALLITSPEPRTGKSTLSANLSLVCAQDGIRVVLVDADLRRPTLHQLFGLDNYIGLTDLLVGDSQDASSCMQETEYDNLRLITCGPVPPNPSELLGSRQMESVLAEIEHEADLVIIDSPPVLAVTDSAVLASKVDGVLLLIEAKRTSHDAARHAHQALQSVGANILGGVLTKVKIPHRSSSYYYYSRRVQPPRRRMVDWWRRLLSAYKKRRNAASKRTDREGWQTEREAMAYRDD